MPVAGLSVPSCSYNTNSDHLSSTHQSYLGWNPDYFKNKAAAHGEHVVSCVEHILASVDYPEIGYKRVTGLLQLHKAMVRADWIEPVKWL